VSRLIIIRGNSGSGKTTISKAVQSHLGEGTMLVSQDEVRIRMLNVENKADNPAIQLIYDLVMYGNALGTTVILEGILSNKKYSKMLHRLIDDFKGEVFAYYIDVSFEETLRRHATKDNYQEFGEDEMRLWWKDRNHLGIADEKIIDESMDVDSAVKHIIGNLKPQKE
jgi:adenylate kinase family enzyme